MPGLKYLILTIILLIIYYKDSLKAKKTMNKLVKDFRDKDNFRAVDAIFKIGGIPINVNYRYVEEELIYLLDNSDAEAVFYHAC